VRLVEVSHPWDRSAKEEMGKARVNGEQMSDMLMMRRGVRGVMSAYPDSAIKIGATQIKLDTRLLGDSWKAVLEEILRSNRA